MTEEKVKAIIDQLKKQLPELLDEVKDDIEAEEWYDALENIQTVYTAITGVVAVYEFIEATKED